MGSREKDQYAPHQPLLSSLIVRATESVGVDGGAAEYEPGEVRPDPPSSYSRPGRFSENNGYRIRAGSGSPPPVRPRGGSGSPLPVRPIGGHRFSHEFDHSGGPTRSRGYGGRRSPLPPRRHRDYSPPMRSRTRGENKFVGNRGFDGSGFGRGSYRGGDDMARNNPNMRRRGDWLCHDPLCNNLNFARREQCNKCKIPRYPPPRGRSPPRRGYPGPPSPRHQTGRPLNRSPVRPLIGHRSPVRPLIGHRSPRPSLRDQPPRDLLIGGHPPSHGHETPRFHDHQLRRDRLDFREDEHRERNKLDRSITSDWARREASSPTRDKWTHHDTRQRSRSPNRGGLPIKDGDHHRRDLYVERRREDRHGVNQNHHHHRK
ncbi:uncharacterized protein LOC124912232 [Impatiens glandulifera]|uniref:uncharacterized protein LOC124912232 n=1 Tax=Impatiens glandulifera TaxID=253017 RepID=UPI001FB0FB04|nr:uncharacterized protein LOC124912232 [Impatiens glandulifera]